MQFTRNFDGRGFIAAWTASERAREVDRAVRKAIEVLTSHPYNLPKAEIKRAYSEGGPLNPNDILVLYTLSAWRDQHPSA